MQGEAAQAEGRSASATVTRRADRRGASRACSKGVWWLRETPKRPLMQLDQGRGVLGIGRPRRAGQSLGRGDTPNGRGRGQSKQFALTSELQIVFLHRSVAQERVSDEWKERPKKFGGGS